MPVKIVTDSTADLPPELIEQFGITVVPVYVLFGQEVFRDGVDISQDEVYRRIMSENTPATRMTLWKFMTGCWREQLNK
jgi:fatty acid-binding protein DegV